LHGDAPAVCAEGDPGHESWDFNAANFAAFAAVANTDVIELLNARSVIVVKCHRNPRSVVAHRQKRAPEIAHFLLVWKWIDWRYQLTTGDTIENGQPARLFWS
jgi:hypothetical protein